MKKILVAFLLTFGLYAGTASAVTVTLNPANQEILTVGDGIISSPTGREVDNFSQAQSTDANGADIPVDFWVGVDVIANSVNSSITAEDQTDPGGVTTRLNIDLYSVLSVSGNDWTTDTLLDSALPSPLLATLAQGLYLINITGSLPAGTVLLEHNYGVRISSVVPVPAAAWLFGTAILGFLGFRRKTKAAAA